MIVGVVRIGAQRASLRQRLTAVLAGTFFATVFGFAVGAANPAPAAAYTPPYYSGRDVLPQARELHPDRRLGPQ